MAITIKEIAEKLNLNPSTVSRALNGSPRVSEKTKEKVRKAASRLNYTPNLWAQNLVGASSKIVGCLVLELTNTFYIPMVRAIEDVAFKNDHIVILGESRKEVEIERRTIERFLRMRIAGVIITPTLSELEHLSVLRNENIPVIIAGRSVKDFDSINVNNYRSGFLAAEHLLELGHKKIGFVQSGNPYNFPEKKRREGLKKALSKKGISLSALYNISNNKVDAGESAAELWLKDKHRPSGVFCTNDMVAMGFIQGLLRLGVKIPNDVSVIGHDDIPFADSFIVPLTTIVFPKYDLGYQSMLLLLERLKNKNYYGPVQNISLEPELIIRSSTKRIDAVY